MYDINLLRSNDLETRRKAAQELALEYGNRKVIIETLLPANKLPQPRSVEGVLIRFKTCKSFTVAQWVRMSLFPNTLFVSLVGVAKQRPKKTKVKLPAVPKLVHPVLPEPKKRYNVIRENEVEKTEAVEVQQVELPADVPAVVPEAVEVPSMPAPVDAPDLSKLRKPELRKYILAKGGTVKTRMSKDELYELAKTL